VPGLALASWIWEEKEAPEEDPPSR